MKRKRKKKKLKNMRSRRRRRTHECNIIKEMDRKSGTGPEHWGEK